MLGSNFLSKGQVFATRQYRGKVTPPLTVLEDTSRYVANGAFKASGQPAWVKLPSGLWAMDFNSANPDYVTIPANQTQLDFTSTDFSIVAAIYPDALATAGIFDRSDTDVDGYYFLIVSGGYLYFRTNQASAHQNTYGTAGDLTVATWHIVAVTRRGAVAKLYVDGVDVTNVSGTHIDPLTSARVAIIGIEEGLVSNPFDGKIGFLDVYNYALSRSQIQRHYFGV